MLTREGWLKHWQMAVGQSLKAHLTLMRGKGVNLGPQRECPGSWDFPWFPGARQGMPRLPLQRLHGPFFGSVFACTS